MTAIVFIDTETTGVHPDREVWEVAMIREGYGEYSFFVDCELDQADPFGLNVGRFYDRHPWGMYLSGKIPDPFMVVKNDGDFLRQKDAAITVAQWTHGATLIGAVPSFDERTLDPLLRKHGIMPAWHYHPGDVEAMAVGWLWGRAGRRNSLSAEQLADLLTPPWNSTDLSKACGVEMPTEEERHTALGDALWVKRWYDAITQSVESERVKGIR